MKPTVEPAVLIRGLEFGGSKPLFCIPLVAGNLDQLTEQADIARGLKPELVEWRADFFQDLTPSALVGAARVLRELLVEQAIIFTLRISNEGGVQEISQSARHCLIEAVLRSKTVDIVDLELANEPEFLDSLMAVASECGVWILLAFHDFKGTPANDLLLDRIAAMRLRGANIAKIAVMPRTPDDVMRLFQVTIAARNLFPALPLATMSMGALGSISRVAGFLYGSDMSFAVGKEPSAPGQVPIEDARKMAEMLLHYS
jgi:3-dehydroquinate dehydratase-1